MESRSFEVETMGDNDDAFGIVVVILFFMMCVVVVSVNGLAVDAL